MLEHGLAFAVTVLTWWSSTAVILRLCALPGRACALSLMIGGGVSIVALWVLATNAREVGTSATYLSFLSAIGVWGWLEIAFLTGFLTGPRRTSCPPEVTGWRRFRVAVEALLYHELAIVAAGGLVVWATWGAPNQTGRDAFLILVIMRISAKLNIFLGVPNLTDGLLPARLSYLKSYFRKRSWNPLFPVSIAGSSALAAMLARRIIAVEGAEALGSMLLLSLLLLAILEHFFMILPLPDGALWEWAAPAGAGKSTCKPLSRN